MKNSIFVVTDKEAGWDCVVGVYKAESEEKVKEHLSEEWGEFNDDINHIHEVFDITVIK